MISLTPQRPTTRSACPPRDPQTGKRGCRFVSCRHHLYLDVTRSGRLRLNFPGLEVSQMSETCSIDVSDNHPRSLEAIGEIMGGLSRERVRQLEQRALSTFRALATPGLLDHVDYLGAPPADVLQIGGGKTGAPCVHLDLADYSPHTPWGELPRGFRVRRLRQRLGWSTSALGEKIKTHRSVLHRIEIGAWDLTTDRMLSRVMRGLRMSVSALDKAGAPSLGRASRPLQSPARTSGSLRLDYLLGLDVSRSTVPLRCERERMARGLSMHEMATLMGLRIGRYHGVEREKMRSTKEERQALRDLEQERQALTMTRDHEEAA